jgi:radical SAM enzyme (TIGR01210 family)
MVKIFTSGSFFDEAEVPPEARAVVAEAFRGNLVIAETRSEYVDAGILEDFAARIDTGRWSRPLYVAMGLETTDDFIREKCIDKGFTLADYREAVAVARSAGAGIKTYLMMKPPFLTEREALEDMHRSIAEAAPFSDIISMNLCTVQNRTEVEYYWKRGAFRPPYLWSALEVLEAAPCHVQCDPVGGGHGRGPHNCGSCDPDIVKGIREYSLNGDRSLLRALKEKECGCKAEWEFVLENERPYCMPLTK